MNYSGPKRLRSTRSRVEQLRTAKRAQRNRERAQGLTYVQLKLPQKLATKLLVAARTEDFPEKLDQLLDRLVVRVIDFPMLTDISWNRVDEYISPREAFQLYERNWRFIDQNKLLEHEKILLQYLTSHYGAGVINA